MKKNIIYGMIAGCVALILLIGAVMSMPQSQEDPNPTTGASESTGMTTAATTQPSSGAKESTGESTFPSQSDETQPQSQPAEPETKPTEPATQPTEPATQPTEPATQPTEPVTQPTEPETEPTKDETSGIRFITWPETISGGETGTVTIQGKPNTTYTIKVYYKSGPSGAKGLEDQVSGADGYVTGTWKVSKNTKAGDFKIVVSGGGETVQVPFSVLD